jgi:hypothetical protein
MDSRPSGTSGFAQNRPEYRYFTTLLRKYARFSALVAAFGIVPAHFSEIVVDNTLNDTGHRALRSDGA